MELAQFLELSLSAGAAGLNRANLFKTNRSSCSGRLCCWLDSFSWNAAVSKQKLIDETDTFVGR